MPEFYSDDKRTARKQYNCVECSAPILKGEHHLYYRGKWDGDFSDGRQHIDCLNACVHIRKLQDGDCIPFGGLLEWYSDGKPIDKTKELNNLLRALMAKVLRRHRFHRSFRKWSDGVLMNKKYGQSWQPVSQPSLKADKGELE